MTRSLAALAAGAVIGLGVFVVSAGHRGRFRMTWSLRQVLRGREMHVVVAGSVLVGVWVLTQWVFVALVSSVVVTMGSVAFGRHRSRRDDRALVEGIAVWTEQLRDTLAGSHGLEQTIVATTSHAPDVLRLPLERLVASMPYVPLSVGLARLARDIDHPTADFVVAALGTASTRQVRELGALLGHLAICARDEARMHTRIWVGRSRTRSAVRIISVVVIAFVGGLALLNPQYLAPYGSAEGQIVLSVVVVTFFSALLMMQRLAVVTTPERFVGRRSRSVT
jgi:tight adherence protein B